jgi:CRP/FNR family cyclic AMP-dependent transcriptional regulator
MNLLSSGIVDGLPARALERGEILIEEGGHGTELYFLKSGGVEVLKGDTLITKEFEPGAVFGEMSVLLGCYSTATVKVILPSVFYTAEKGAEFLKSNPQLSLYLATLLAMRLEAVTRYLADVKRQYADEGGHLGMVESLLSTLMMRHPRRVERGDRGH